MRGLRTQEASLSMLNGPARHPRTTHALEEPKYQVLETVQVSKGRGGSENIVVWTESTSIISGNANARSRYEKNAYDGLRHDSLNLGRHDG